MLALPLIIVAIVAVTSLGLSNIDAHPHDRRDLHAADLRGPCARTVLVERDLDYVQAAKLRGERAPYIMFVEILPNVTAPILVEATVRIGYAIFTIASLSFLGYGVQPPSPDWGLQVADNYSVISFAWWTVLFPSLAIGSLVVSVNLISDGVTQVVDTMSALEQVPVAAAETTAALELRDLDVVYQRARARSPGAARRQPERRAR